MICFLVNFLLTDILDIIDSINNSFTSVFDSVPVLSGVQYSYIS